MNFVTLKRSHLKRNIIIGVTVICVISAIILNFTRAKYRTTQSIPLVNGTINYQPYDLKMIAIYLNNEKIDTLPEGDYELTSDSYCSVNNEKNDNITLSYNSKTKTLVASTIDTKNTKCYLYFEEAKKYGSFYEQLLADNPVRLTRNDFTEPLTYDNIGILYSVNGKWTEDESTVYYFAGNALNNWVKFGQDENGNDLYWRIIRTNEDGSIRMLYSGTSPDTEVGYINNGFYAFNLDRNDPMSGGYMYGTSGSLENNRTNENDSNAKIVIDEWYKNNLLNDYDKYISKTAIYCNDRATDNKYTTNGLFNYASRLRLDSNYSNFSPTYKCGNAPNGTLYEDASIADKFSVSTASGGNGYLTYPVALMTADEVAYAGGVYAKGATTWYYYNSVGGSIVGIYKWWTLTPSNFESASNSFGIFAVAGTSRNETYGYFNNMGGFQSTQNGGFTLRPVISLKSCVEWTSGNGSPDNPYQVSINSACSSSEN